MLPPPNPGRHGRGYNIVIDAAMDRVAANRMASRLLGLGYTSHIFPTRINGQTWYRVQVGPYPSRTTRRRRRRNCVPLTRPVTSITPVRPARRQHMEPRRVRIPRSLTRMTPAQPTRDRMTTVAATPHPQIDKPGSGWLTGGEMKMMTLEAQGWIASVVAHHRARLRSGIVIQRSAGLSKGPWARSPAALFFFGFPRVLDLCVWCADGLGRARWSSQASASSKPWSRRATT